MGFTRYTIHRDIPMGKWNVFEVVDGREWFVCAFERLEDAHMKPFINNPRKITERSLKRLRDDL